MRNLFRGLSAAVLSVAVFAPSALAADVTLRVEGGDRTLVRSTTVSLPGPAVDKTDEGGTTCLPTSGGSALELVTAGDWGGRADGQGQRVEHILGEVNLLGDEYAGRFWGVFRNNGSSYQGLCGITPQQGDELLLAPVCFDTTTERCFSGNPLDLAAPATARPGEPFAVTAAEFAQDYDNGTAEGAATIRRPAGGATVTGRGASATTDADGRATLALTERGPAELVVTRADDIRDSVTVCVTDGQDGFCGTRTPSGETFGQPTAEQQGSARPKDTTAPWAVIKRIREGQRFRRARAPRVLRARIGEPVATASGGLADDASGLLEVKVRLTRTDRGRCSSYSRTRERFLPRRCGARNGWWFKVGDSASVDYQLASRLPRGRYVLDVKAMDRAFNIDRRRKRGLNRVVFRVR